MSKEPARRYASALEMAQDRGKILRWLKTRGEEDGKNLLELTQMVALITLLDEREDEEADMVKQHRSVEFSKAMSGLLVGATLGLCSLAAHAALMVTAANQMFTENFNTLAITGSPSASDPIAWSNDSTLPGWSLFSRRPSDPTALTSYRAGAGTDNTGSFYSFGSSGSGERALGGIGSQGTYYGEPSSGTVAGWFAVAFTNNSGSALEGFAVTFDGEQWRNGGNATGD